MVFCPSATKKPHSDVGGCAPTPKKLSHETAKIAYPISSEH